MSRRKTGRVTIRDIARRTGLSPITVSRALRGDAEVRPDTRARVEGEAERSGYVPNLVAVALASNRSRVVGVVIPTLLDANFAATVEGISRVLRRHNYQFILGSSGYDPADEEQVVRTLLRRRVDGLILPALDHNDITRSLVEKNRLPVVEIGNLPHDAIASVVGYSNERACYAATEHLVASGRRRLAYVGGLGDANANDRARLAGFRSCLAAYGLAIDERLILLVDYTPHAIIPAIDRLAATLGEFDGLVVGGELWSPIVALEFARRGIAVPEAVAMIGLGDVEHADFLPTPLTTIVFPSVRSGEVAAELIIDRCNGDSAAPSAWDLGFELRVRASSRVPSVR